MNSIFNALSQGYTASQILGFLSKSVPSLGNSIKKAKSIGYEAEQILGFLAKSSNTSFHPGMSESEIHAKARSQDAKLSKYGLAAISALAASPLVAYATQGAMSRALPSSLTHGGVQSPQINNPSGPNAPNPTAPSPAPMQGVPQTQQGLNNAQMPIQGGSNGPGTPQLPGQPQSTTNTHPLQPPINSIQGAQSQPNPNNIPQPPTQPQASIVQRDTQKNIDLIKNIGIEPNLKNMIKGGMSTEDIAAVLPKMIGKEASKALRSAEGGMEGVIEDYAKEIAATKEIHGQENPVNPMQENVKELENILPEDEKDLQESEPINEPEGIKKNQTVATPQGIGEVKEIRNGKALVEVDGKLHKVDEENLEAEPKDIEEAVRSVMNSIPEGMKSSAMQTAIHIPIPGVNLMVTKFWNGKIAWYLDVEPELYESIALGLYEPKTKGKTGIAEYKPGVIDSRGAGLSEQITRNPKYSKENKGKTWGYASSEYDAMSHIQHILEKMSKEKYDEEGNTIISKKRTKKRP